MKRYLLILCFCSSCFLPAIALAEDAPAVARYTLNGQEADVTVNPTMAGDPILTIDIEANQPVKFTRISICMESDTECKEPIKYFSYNTVSSTVSKEWNGYSGGSEPSPAPTGSYWLKVLLKRGDEDSVPVNLTSHKIKVGTVGVGTGNGDGDEDNESEDGGGGATTTSTSTPVTPSSSNSNSSGSSHSSQSELSSIRESLPKVGVGRNRLAMVDAPLDFHIVYENKNDSALSVVWSFGDGESKEGETVSHLYRFPGIYNVVATAHFRDGNESVSRTKVTVVKPDVSIASVNQKDGSVVLENASNLEANVGGWGLRTASSSFTFPLDTIIDPKSSLVVSFEMISLPTDFVGPLFLSTPKNKALSWKDISAAAADSLESIAESDRLTKLKEQLAIVERGVALLRQQNAAGIGIVVAAPIPSADKVETEDSSIAVVRPASNMASVNQAADDTITLDDKNKEKKGIMYWIRNLFVR